MTIIIREATKDDAAFIAEFSRQTFYETYVDYNEQSNMDKFLNEQFTTEALMAEVGSANNIFLVAVVDNNIEGYVRLRDKEAEGLKNSIEIARIYASKKMVGKGVGKKLMEASIELAKKLKRRYLWLGVWENNLRAIEFYKKFGFEKFADSHFLLGDDLQNDWLLKKQIQ